MDRNTKDKVTKGQRDNRTKRQRDKGTKERRYNGTRGWKLLFCLLRDRETKDKWINEQEIGSNRYRDKGTNGQRNIGQLHKETKGRVTMGQKET